MMYARAAPLGLNWRRTVLYPDPPAAWLEARPRRSVRETRLVEVESQLRLRHAHLDRQGRGPAGEAATKQLAISCLVNRLSGMANYGTNEGS